MCFNFLYSFFFLKHFSLEEKLTEVRLNTHIYIYIYIYIYIGRHVKRHLLLLDFKLKTLN